MAYIKNLWKDQKVERPKTYEMQNNPDGSTTLIDSFGQVTELGTPVNADHMNHIENGIANSATVDLDNLSEKGNARFEEKANKDLTNTGMITNCILEAPNGVITFSGVNVNVKNGIKFLAPNGLNSDGSLNNKILNIEKDLFRDISADHRGVLKIAFFLNPSNIYTCLAERFFVGKEKDLPTKLNSTEVFRYYAYDTNKFYNTSGSTTPNWVIFEDIAFGGIINYDGSKVTDINYYNPVNLLKQSDKSQISGWGMSSHKSISLTLGKNGSTYTAPANGYYYLNKTAGADWHYIEITGDTNASQYPLHGSWKSDYRTAPLKILYPVLKGDVIKVNYNATGKTNWFRFIYAEGEV